MKKLFLTAAIALMTVGFAGAQCCKTGEKAPAKKECKCGKTCKCGKDGKTCKCGKKPCGQKPCPKKGSCCKK